MCVRGHLSGAAITFELELVGGGTRRLQASSLLEVVVATVTGVGSRDGMMGRGRSPGRLLPPLGTETPPPAQPLARPPLLLLLLPGAAPARETKRSRRSHVPRKSLSKRWLCRDIIHTEKEREAGLEAASQEEPGFA